MLPARNLRRLGTVPRLSTFLALAAGITLLAAAVVPAGAGSWKGQETQKDGALYVTNPATGMEAPATVDLKELWRVGGESENEEEFFGVIVRVTTDPKGNIYVLDNQLSEVKVYDPSGKFLKKIGREGEGPGEFRRPGDMFFLPDGNLGVMQTVPGKIVMLKPTGEPAGDFPLPAPEGGGFQVLRGGRLAGKQLVLARQLQTIDQAAGKMSQTVSLDRVDLKGKVGGSYAKLDRTLQFANLVIDEKTFGTWEQGGRWDTGADGRVYVALGDNYEITVFNADGSKDRIIQRACERYQRTAEEAAEIKGIYEAFTRGAPNAKVEVNNYDADVGALYSRDDGSLWVLSSHGMRKQPKGTVGVFDVFDSKGRFVRQVTLRGQGDPHKDGYFFVGDRLYVVTGFLDALVASIGGGEKQEEDPSTSPMELICYRVEAPMVAKGN